MEEIFHQIAIWLRPGRILGALGGPDPRGYNRGPKRLKMKKEKKRKKERKKKRKRKGQRKKRKKGTRNKKDLDRKVNQHDERGSIQDQAGLQGRKLQGRQIDRG